MTGDRLRRPPPGEWLSYGRDYANQRYSPLTQITTHNVAALTPRMILQPNIDLLGGLATSPLVVGSTMIITTSWNHLIAYDLRTGQERWHYQHHVGTIHVCCGASNRGAAIGYGTVYMATLDAQLIAVDAETGALRWSKQVNDPDEGYSTTMAPIVVDSLVIIGSSGGEFGVRGNVTAYSARTGEQRWRWNAIPAPEDGGWWGRWSDTTPTGEALHRDIAREHADSAIFADAWKTGGAPVWTPPAYDSDRGLLFYGVGNPSPEADGTVRPGDNLYSGSIVALEVATGRLRWYYQYVPHDLWDMDAASPPILVRDRSRTLVVQATKMGWVYEFDAGSGALVRRSEPFVPQSNMFAIPTADGVRIAPGSGGGVDWSPIAYSPLRHAVYVPGVHEPMVFTRAPSPRVAGQIWLGGAQRDAPDGESWGTFSAIDIASGKILWQARTTMPLVAVGVLATAGGLVFSGEPSGWLRAYDAATGAVRWQFNCGAGVDAPPVSFELDGRQYVAVAAGGNTYGARRGDAIVIFGLTS